MRSAARHSCMGGDYPVPVHSRVIRNKNLACDDSEGVRDSSREGLSLPYSPYLTEVGLNIALSVWTFHSLVIEKTLRFHTGRGGECALPGAP